MSAAELRRSMTSRRGRSRSRRTLEARRATRPGASAGRCATRCSAPTTDFDLATSATPEQVQRLFPRTVAVGVKYGTVGVLDRRPACCTR